MTSTHVVNVVKRLTQAQKVGHGGTLDPLATGVLPIAMGEATKTVAYVMDARKSYGFTLRFGEARDTDDAAGAVIATSDRRPSDDEIRGALPQFQRRDPAGSAAICGRQGPGRARLRHCPPRRDRRAGAARDTGSTSSSSSPGPIRIMRAFRMTCGKGAYVRAIARDLGRLLGCHAHVGACGAPRVGSFSVDNAVSLEALARIVEDEIAAASSGSVTTALAGIPALAVTEPQALPAPGRAAGASSPPPFWARRRASRRRSGRCARAS